MTWYLYGFAAGVPMGLPCGVGGRPVLAAMADEICLLISQWDDEPAPPLTGEAVLAHEQVVEAAMLAYAVLPCRFGTVVERAFCLDFVAAHADRIHTRLQAVTGQVEVTLKVFDRTGESTPAHPDGPRSGTAYLLRKQVDVHQEQERHGRAGALADEIDVVLSPWATDRHRQLAPSGDVLVAMTYLIPLAATTAWTDAAETLHDRFADYDFLATGPWPPYHFTEGKTRDGGTFEQDPGTAR